MQPTLSLLDLLFYSAWKHVHLCCGPLLRIAGTDLQVLPQDIDPQYGIAHSPLGPSPSQSPLARAFGPAPTVPQSAYTSALSRTASLSSSGKLSRLSRSSTHQDSANQDASGAGAIDSAKAGTSAKTRKGSGEGEISSSVPKGSGLLPPVEEVQRAARC